MATGLRRVCLTHTQTNHPSGTSALQTFLRNPHGPIINNGINSYDNINKTICIERYRYVGIKVVFCFWTRDTSIACSQTTWSSSFNLCMMWKNVHVSSRRVPCRCLIKPECSKTNSAEEYLHVQFTLESPRLCGQIIKQSSRFFRLMWDDLMKSRGEAGGGQPLEILSLKMRDNNQRQLWWSAVIKRRYIWRYVLKQHQCSMCTSEGPVMNSTIFKRHGLCVYTGMIMIPPYGNTSWLGLVQTFYFKFHLRHTVAMVSTWEAGVVWVGILF